MKKTAKNIIIALVVLLVLGVAAVVLMKLPAADSEVQTEESSASSEAIVETGSILDNNINDVVEIVVENNIVGETWEIIPTKDSEDVEENNTFTFKNLEGTKVLNSQIASVARNFYLLSSKKVIGEVQNLAEYGLDGDGMAKGTTTYKDGTTTTIIIGRTAGESSGRYILYDGTVYIASVASQLEQKQMDFVNKQVLTIASNNEVAEDGTIVENEAVTGYMKFSGKNYPEEINLEASDNRVYTYVMSTPIFAGASTSQMDSIVEQVTSIQADTVAVVNATEEDLTEWGFDDPEVVFDFEINDEVHKLVLGKLVDGQYSLMVDDKATIYLIDKSSVNAWSNKTVFELRESYVYLINIKQVETLTVEDKNGKNVYDVTRSINEEKSSEGQPFYDLSIEKDGKEVSYDTAYQPFYMSMLSVCVMNEETVEPVGDALITFNYEYFEGDDVDVIEFYAHPTNDRRCVAVLNGQTVGVVRNSDIESLIEKNDIIGNFGSLE